MAIRFGIRGFGGEIGDTCSRVFMGMNRSRFNAFANVTGGTVQAFIRQKPGVSIRETIAADRSYLKLTNQGGLKQNTASSYGYAPTISSVGFDPNIAGRVNVVGADGRVLNIDYKTVPETNVGLRELANLDFLIDATGVGLKKDAGEQNPALYAAYPNLTVFISAPCKTVKGAPHFLNGLGTRFYQPAQINATGSCSTHAGVDLIRYVREGLIEALDIAQEDIIIEGGQFNATHSLTPTDNKILPWYKGAYLAQTTGFGGAAKVVYPVSQIGNIAAATGRYYSYYDVDGVQANGVSMYSLAMTLSVPKGSTTITEDMIRNILIAAAKDHEGKKHIGILQPDFDIADNKKVGAFTTLALSGMTPTAILALKGNLKIVKLSGHKVLEGKEYDQYIVTFNNVAYDNRLGFTVDFLEEANLITRTRLGQELIPSFDHQADLGDELAFIRTPAGQVLFDKALQATHGELLLK